MVGHAAKPSFKDSAYEPVGLVHPSNRVSDDYDCGLTPTKEQGDGTRRDSISLNSAAHLNPRQSMSASPRPMPFPHADYASASAAAATIPSASQATSSTTKSHKANNSSWDLLAGIRKDFEDFDPRNAREAHLQFAQGDIPDNSVSLQVLVTCWHFPLNAICLVYTLLQLPPQCFNSNTLGVVHHTNRCHLMDSWDSICYKVSLRKAVAVNSAN